MLDFEISARIDLSFGIDLPADPTSDDSVFISVKDLTFVT